jgi:TP901 family phage tail tape measure protein
MAAINLDVGANTRRAERDIQRLVSRSYNINLKTRGDQPLGRITGQVNEFTKSLDASNARVIAFGASAGIIFGVQRAFAALTSSVIDTQKSLADINVILNVSTSQLQKFGGELFGIAKNTGQSFEEVAKAATEFSRQGLGIVETLKRTNEALILSRLSGLDTVKSVEALTAAVNSFASQAVTATEVVNKFANVDAAFAVSSSDLAEALQRVGSSAAQSGVNLDELIAIVTAAQQTTARGGAVIGNSFKTIFTRLQRSKVVNLLEGLGVDTKDSSGQIKSTINLLTDLAKVYDNLGTLQQAEVAEKVGGVFQINILKAALADLGKEFSIYNSALEISGSSTDQAIRRNEELNKTYAAQLNAIRENAKQLGASVGDRLFGPAFNRVVGNANDILGGVNAGDGSSIGATLGKGILDGLGQVIAGPGLALLGGIFIKLFADLSKFVGGSLKELLNLNNASKQQQALQQSIGAILQKNPELFKLMQQGTVGLNKGAEILLTSLRAQTVELQKQQAIAAKIAAQFLRSGNVTMVGGMPTATAIKPSKTKSGGFIPNFSVQSELKGIKKSPDYTSSQKRKAAGDIRTANIPGLGKTVYNGQEAIAPSDQVAMALGYPAGTKPKNPAEKYSILTPAMQDNLGFSAKGFIPNFAFDPTNLRSSAAGKVFDNAIALSTRLKTAYVEDREILDFFPNVLGSIKPPRLKTDVGINPLTKYGDAKLADPSGGQKDKLAASYISKILRSGSFSSIEKISEGQFPLYNITSPPGGAILSPGNKQDKLGNILRAGSGTLVQTNKTVANVLNKKGIPLKNASLQVSNVLFDYVSGITRENIYGKIDSKKNNLNYRDRSTRESAAFSIAKKFGVNAPKASGFIPNFAKASKAGAVNLGDISSNPSYRSKLLSVIIPQPSKSLLRFPAEAKYGDTLYTTTGLPVSGPNPDITKRLSQQNIPNLHKNIGKVVLDQANVFGQSLGATKFMSSVSELPNLGGVNSAAGIAFEGGVLNALGKSIGSKNARVDFSSASLNSQVKKIFNNAPGSYEAKNRPSKSLINDAFLKFLSRAKPGFVKSPRSGGFKEAQALRAQALKNFELEGRTYKRGPQLNSAIEKEIAKIRSSRSMATGFIPNFEEMKQSAMSAERKAGKGAKIDEYKGLLYVRQPGQSSNFKTMMKEDHPEGFAAAVANSAKSQGIASQGFIPNFAINESTAPADLTASISAVVTQLGGLAFMLSFAKGQYQESLKQLTSANVAAAKVQAQNVLALKKLQAGGGVRNEPGGFLNAQQSIKRAEAGTFAQKSGALLGSNALALTFLGPIIAETIKNAIGQQTKEARVQSSVASGFGQAATFAGFGALMTPMNPLVGGGVGLAAGAMLGLVDVVKQASTNIPELSAAAKKASEELTKINDAGQKAQTQFEQISQLRESGQQEKAGKLEADLLKLIGKEFRDRPELASQAASAVINKDFQSLTKALEENTRAVLKEKQAQDLKLLIGEFSEKTDPKKLGEQFLDIFKISATNTPSAEIQKLLSILPKENLNVKKIKAEQSAAYSGYAVDTSELDKATAIGREIESFVKNTQEFKSLAEEEQNKLLSSLRNATFIGELINQLKEPITDINATAEAISRNSAQGNKIIAAITDSLAKAQSIYAQFAINAQAAVDLQLSGQRSIREAYKNIAESQGQRDESLLTAVGNPQAAKNVRIDTEIKKFNTEFANAVNSSFDSIISNVASAVITSGQKTLTGFSDIQSGSEGAEGRAIQNIDAATAFAEAFQREFNINNFKDLIGIGGENFDIQDFKGFNVQSVLNEISSKLNFDQGDPEAKALLERIRESLNQANTKLLDQKAILAQQLTVLANQEYAANFQELMTAITKSFGGMESFRNFNNQFSMTDELNRAIGSLFGLRNASGPKTDIETARALSSIVEELSKLAGSNIVTNSQGGLRPELAPVIDAIVQGRALDIEKTINSVLKGPLSKTGQGGALQTAFLNELIDNLGISRTKEDGTLKTQQELVREVALKNAEMQTKAELGVGEINKQVLDQAFNMLPDSLKKAFKEQGMGAFNSIEQIALAQDLARNQLLQQILDTLRTGAGEKYGDFSASKTGTFNQDAAGGGGLNPTGVGSAESINNYTPQAVVEQAKTPGTDSFSKSVNDGVSTFNDVNFTGEDGSPRTLSKWFNEQAPLDLTTGLTTKLSDLNGVIGAVINDEMIPDNSSENPMMVPKDPLGLGINDAIGTTAAEVAGTDPELQKAADLIRNTDSRYSDNVPLTIEDINDKYTSSSSSSSSDAYQSQLDKDYEEWKAKNKAKGEVPKGFKDEISSIRRGVGGAKPWHSPYLTEINGEPAWVHTGETVTEMGPNGEMGVLTPDMKKALNFAEGSIPDDSAVAAFLSQFRQKRSTRFGDKNYKKVRDWFRANENAVTQTSTVGGRTPENTLLTRGTGKGPGALRGLQNFIQYGGGESGLFDNSAPNSRPLGYWSGDTSNSGRQFIAMNTDLIDRFSAQDFSTRRHEIVHGMQADTAGSKAGEMFKGKTNKFFGQALADNNKFGKWQGLIAETQARIIQERSIPGGLLKMIKDSPSYARNAVNNAERFISAALSGNEEVYLKAANEQLGASKIYSNISKYAGFLGDSDLIKFATGASRASSKFMRQVGAGNVSVSEAGKGMVEQFRNIPQLLKDPQMLKQLGGGLLKGGAVGASTQYAGEKLIPKFDGKNEDGDMSYLEEVVNELRSFGIATGSGAAAGAAGTGGAGTILGAIAGGTTDVLGKLWKLGSSTAELAKLTWDEYGREDRLNAQQSELQNRSKKLAEQAKLRRQKSETQRMENMGMLKQKGPSVSMPMMPSTLDFANAATRNKQQTQFNKQITASQTKPNNPYKLIGGKGNAPATQIDTRTGTGTLVPRAEAVNPSRGISTSTSYAQDPEVAAAIKTGNISAIEKATEKARERAGKSLQTPESDFARRYKFEQDLSKAIGGIATGGTQAEVDAYYKKKAEEAGMSDRFITDYIEPREREIIAREQQKLNPPKRNFTEKGARGRLKEMLDGYDALMRGNRSMAQTQAYQAKKQELQKLFTSGEFEKIYNTYDSLPKSDQPRGTRMADGSFTVAPPTPIPEPTFRSADEARAAGRTVLKPGGVGAYKTKPSLGTSGAPTPGGGRTVFNAPYINSEIPKAMAAANEAATSASISQTLAISAFNRGDSKLDPREMDFTPKALPPVLDYSSSVAQPGLNNYNRAMNLSPINPGGIDLYNNLKGTEREDGSVSTGIPKSWDTIYKIEEEKKKAKNYAQGLVSKSFLAELANGGSPLKSSVPGIGDVVIDKNEELSAANAVARKGLSQGMYESKKMQNISAQSFTPNFAVKKADTQPSPNNFSIKLGDMVINSSAVQNNPDGYGKDFGSELQSRIPDVVEQIKADMDKKYGRVADLVRQNENMFVNKVPPKSRGNAALRT